MPDIIELSFDVTTSFIKILFRDHNLGKNLSEGARKTKEAAWRTALSMAPQVESYMKVNAPWTDQTGNARSGLAARAFRDDDVIGIVLFHQVAYGIFLESRWNGRYAIINPSIQEMGPKVMRRFERLLERL